MSELHHYPGFTGFEDLHIHLLSAIDTSLQAIAKSTVESERAAKDFHLASLAQQIAAQDGRATIQPSDVETAQSNLRLSSKPALFDRLDEMRAHTSPLLAFPLGRLSNRL